MQQQSDYIYPPPPEDKVTTMTDEQFELFVQICEQLVAVLRDDKPFAEVEHYLGKMTYRSETRNVQVYSHPELPKDMGMSIYFLNTGNPKMFYPSRVKIDASYLQGLDHVKLAQRLGLIHGNDWNQMVRPLQPNQATYEFFYKLAAGGTGVDINVPIYYDVTGITTPMLNQNKATPEHTRYFSHMRISQEFKRDPTVADTPSGQPCPYSGVWVSESNPEQKVYVRIRQVMPYREGMRTTWKWEGYQF